eukprot:TRINITY_DN137_c0_g1_i9.p1 TRINITY_DN137_c0_g1~~TRINITY_DN137_c0_g1_i9.p1  ORF type:complete len:530 (+),score=132.56 TRINITY_DN137_c0_g1_i9:48-1637(+)
MNSSTSIVSACLSLFVCCLLFSWGNRGTTQQTSPVLENLMSKRSSEPSKKLANVMTENDLLSKADGDYVKLENSDKLIKTKGPWFLGTCTGTKSSGAWMREWIELQIAVGVDHVWVADDNPANSSDITTGVLKHYERLGYVTIIPPPDLNHTGCRQTSGPNSSLSCAPVKHCFEYASPHVKWLLFADTDEFIFPHNGCSVAEHIKNHCNPDATHIYVKWERFGSSGFETHPNGLMLENFLSSGGTCHNVGNGVCARRPFDNCPECRHSKVIYNTECAKVEHAGWIHWPVNTTDWKAGTLPEYRKREWVKSEGTSAHWKQDKCKYTGLREDAAKCNFWAKFGGGSKRPKEYTPDCCTAGIGYNHYGTQSRQYYERKQTNKKDSLRGWRTQFWGLDLNEVLSFSALKFVRALRKRFTGLGAQVSENVAFVDAGEGRSCFVETNFAYKAVEQTKEVQFGRVRSNAECCAACFKTQMCKAFNVANQQCKLFIGALTTPRTRVVSDFAYMLDATRSRAHGTMAGIPLQSGECGA